MDESQIPHLLEQLGSRQPAQGWRDFLEAYSPLIFQVVRLAGLDADQASNCFLFVCEQLSRDSFRRLRRFRPGGPASFSTWLRAVVRNLTLDWLRKEFGRPRPFRAISRLEPLDEAVFRCIYLEGRAAEEACEVLRPQFPELTPGRFAESLERIQLAMTSRQQWLLSVRGVRPDASPATPEGEEVEARLAGLADLHPDPEAQVAARELQARLDRALERLDAGERLLIRLRFEKGLTLEQVARLARLGNAQAADRRLREILERLRREVG